VSENRELNLPSQRKTLSTFKCDEFVKERLTTFSEKLTSPEFSGVNSLPGIANLGELIETSFNETILSYNRESARYLAEVASEKRETLQDGMRVHVTPLFVANCVRAVEAAEGRLLEWLDGFTAFPEGGWRANADAEREACVEFVQRRVAASRPPGWSLQFEGLDLLLPRLEKEVNEKEGELTVAFGKLVAEKWIAIQKDAIAPDLEEAAPDMWQKLRAKLHENVQQAHDEFKTRVLANVRPGRRIETHLTNIETALGRVVRDRALAATRDISAKIQARFEKRFSCDESRAPRTWSEDTDIAKLYEAARQECLGILHTFATCQLREKTDRIPPNDPLTGVLIGNSAIELIEETFKRESEKKWINAMRVQDSQRNRTKVPRWMMAAYVVLGLPKAISAFRHPWMAILLLVAVFAVVAMFENGWLDRPIEISKACALRSARWVVGKIVKPKRRPKRARTRPARAASPPLRSISHSAVVRRPRTGAATADLEPI
jgi:hypothetical protein